MLTAVLEIWMLLRSVTAAVRVRVPLILTPVTRVRRLVSSLNHKVLGL